MEYVRPHGEKQGYYRRKSERTWLKQYQKEFGKKAALTKGMEGTMVLPDGREISQSAYAMIDQETPAKSEIKPVSQEIKARHSIFHEFKDIMECMAVIRKVERGEMDRHLGMMFVLERMHN